MRKLFTLALCVVSVASAQSTISGGLMAKRGTTSVTCNGYATPIVANLRYQIVGDVVTLSATGTVSGTSNSTTLRCTGLPVFLRPAVFTRAFPIQNVVNSGANSAGMLEVEDLGILTFYRLSGAEYISSFTASGAKGYSRWAVIYSIL